MDPGCVKLGEKDVFCLPSVGRRMQLIHLIFTQPGVHLLEHPVLAADSIIASKAAAVPSSLSARSLAVEHLDSLTHCSLAVSQSRTMHCSIVAL